MTNGEKLKAVLNPRANQIRILGNWVEIEIQKLGINFSCGLDWWNTEYKESTTKNDLSSGLENASPFIDWNNCHTSEQLDSLATTKNDLGVDTDKLISDCEKMSFDIDFFNKPLKVVALDAVKNIVNDLSSVTPQEPRKGHWTEEFNDLEGEVRFTCSSCGEYQLFGTDFCYHCGSDNREVEG